MKSILKLTLGAIAFLFISFTATAQEINTEEIIAASQMQSQKIGDQMELSDQKIAQLKTSIMNFQLGQARVENASADTKGLANTKKEVYYNFKTEVKSIVTPERYAYFMKLYQSLN